MLEVIATTELPHVTGGVDWGHALRTGKQGAKLGAAAGMVYGAGAGIPFGLGGIVGGAAAGGVLGAAAGFAGGAAAGIRDTWGQ